MGIADLHIHSIHSADATATVRAILKQAANIKLDVIALTDHDEIRGAFEAQQLAPKYGVEVIPGVEVSTADGHLLALFVRAAPPAGLSLTETLLLIGRQGGVAIVPHPFNGLRYSLSLNALFVALQNPAAKATVKGIEVFNFSTQGFDKVARKQALALPFAKVSSSDAHIYSTVGAGRTQFPGKTAQDLRRALEENATVPLLSTETSTVRSTLSYVRRIALRKLGYASDVVSSSSVINTEPIFRINSGA
ncbi:MAG: PHP domain-containing protein [Anaerolineales bacterium]|nr:PHP domain-containing protein [Anaerolineales bacterium]